METQAIEKVEVGGPGIMALAKQLSTSGLIPRALQGKPADVLVVLLTGRELGLGPMQSMRGIHVIDGKGVLDAALIVGLVMKAREVCEYFRLVESTDAVATYEAKRAGHPAPVTLSFTIEQAKQAGLAGKQNWRNFPSAMLRARASTALARALFPDLTAGLYDPDELGHEKPHAEAPAPIPTQPPRQSRASVDAEVVEAKPALDPYRNRKGVPHPPGTAAHVPAEVLTETKAKQDAETTKALEAGFDKMHAFDAKAAGRLEAPRETVAKAAKVAEVKAAVEKVLGRAPGIVTFGPVKGKSIPELGDKELADTIDLGDAKLAESPDAPWAPSVQACMDLLLAEHDKRANAQAYVARGEEG